MGVEDNQPSPIYRGPWASGSLMNVVVCNTVSCWHRVSERVVWNPNLVTSLFRVLLSAEPREALGYVERLFPAYCDQTWCSTKKGVHFHWACVTSALTCLGSGGYGEEEKKHSSVSLSALPLTCCFQWEALRPQEGSHWSVDMCQWTCGGA